MSGDFADVISVFAGGVRLTVKAKPGLARPRAPRLVDVGDGKRAIEITVAAAPEDGKANRAITEQLAKALGMKKADVVVKTGSTGRLKVIEISGDPGVLQQRVTAWVQGLIT